MYLLQSDASSGYKSFFILIVNTKIGYMKVSGFPVDVYTMKGKVQCRSCLNRAV